MTIRIVTIRIVTIRIVTTRIRTIGILFCQIASALSALLLTGVALGWTS